MSAAARIAELFAGNERAHGTHGEPDALDARGKRAIRGTARTVEGPATADLWKQHLDGRTPLGVIPIRGDATCLWGSIDVDEYDTNFLSLIEDVHQRKLPLVPCRSKSGGLHLFLFLSEAAAARKVQDALRGAADTLGLKRAEIFPKQTALEEDNNGNWMVMPYFGGTFGGKLREQVGVKKTGAEQTIDEFLHTAERARVRPDQLAKLRSRDDDSKFADGPPCLQKLAAGEGLDEGRKRALFMAGIYFKKKYPDRWKEKMEAQNAQCNRPPLPAEEVFSQQRSLRKKDYQYLCKEQPMCDLCDSSLCRTRTYGVGGGGAAAAGGPVIRAIHKINSESPVWRITVEGSNGVVELTRIDDLTRYRRFTDQCAKQLNRFFPSVKEAAWADELRRVTMTEEQAPEETTQLGIFRDLMEEFLTNRARGERREDLLGRRPWQDPESGRHFFRLGDLANFVHREGLKDSSHRQIGDWIKALGGGRMVTTIKGKSVRLWWAPADSVQATPELNVPPPQASPV